MSDNKQFEMARARRSRTAPEPESHHLSGALASNDSLERKTQPDPLIRRTGLTVFFLLVFVALYLGRPEDLIPWITQLHLPEVVGILAVLSYLFSCILRGSFRMYWTAELKLMLAITVWFALGVPFAIWRGGSFEVLTNGWAKALVIFFLFSQTLVTTSRMRKFLWTVLGSEIAVATISLVTSGKQGIEAGERFNGISSGFLSGNEFSIIIAVTMPFLASFLVLTRGFLSRLLILASYGVLLGMVVLNASRGGVICLIVASILVLTFEFRGMFKAKLVGFVLLGLFLLSAAAAPGIFWQRVKTIWGNTAEVDPEVADKATASSEQRSELLRRSIQFTVQHPVFGVGLGNFVVASGSSTGRSADWIGTHNTFTQISSEAGVPAFILFIGLIGVAIQHSWSATKKRGPMDEMTLLARASVTSLFTLAFAFFFAALAYNIITYLPFLLPAGFQLANRLQQSGSPLRNGELPAHAWVSANYRLRTPLRSHLD